MNTDIARGLGSGLVRRRPPGRVAGIAAALAAMALLLAPSAWATVSGTATLAPIGTGSYLLSVTNTGTDFVEAVALPGNESTKNAVSGSGQCYGLEGALFCTAGLAPAASTQICYSGTAVTEVVFPLNLATHVPVTNAAAVPSCPLADFVPVSAGVPGSTPGSGGASGDAGSAPAANSPAKCKKGFVKKRAHGKTRCVRRKHKKHKH